MAAVVTGETPAPRIFWEEKPPSVETAYAALRLTSAVNLLEDRVFGSLGRRERIATLLREEQSLINAMRDEGTPAAFDLRIVADPGRAVPVEAAIVVRTWQQQPAPVGGLTRGITEVVEHLHAALPRHVTGEPVEDPGEVRALLRPFGSASPVASAVITKPELVGIPKRPDAKVGYYFSVLPFNWVENDWTQLFAMLATARSRVAISVGLLPIQPPGQFTELIQRMATFYTRLARPDTWQGGLYFGQQTLPPDAFAVDAERVFSDYARRYVGRVFAMRVQVSATPALPRGLVEILGSLVSPTDSGAGSHLDRERVSAAYQVRVPRSPAEEQVARWNLDAVDFIMLPGEEHIWQRPDPPAPDLRSLCVLADAKDASCAFRLPAAVDGTLPGFRVRRGGFGQEESLVADGPSIRLGTLSSGRPVHVAVNSLSKHTLVVGTTGSGKTTTVLELLRQLWREHQIPFLVIEPVNADADDYRRLLGEPGFEAVEVITVGDEGGRPLRFNPFEVPKNVLVAEHVANLLACFKSAFGLWEPLPSIYQDALNRTYLTAGILASERSEGESRRWPTTVEFMKAMLHVTKDLGYAGEVKANIEAASIRRAQQLAAGVSASAFLTDQPNRIERLLDHPVILELKSLGSGDEQALMMALVLNAVTEHYQAVRGASQHLVHVTVVEEAHRLLARPGGGKAQEEAQAKEKAAEAFAQTLAENRKYGEGVVIVEQVPTKLVEDAVKNTNLKVLHRLSAEEDRRYVGATMGFDEAQLRFATRLQRGEALVYSDEMAEAMEISVTPALTSAFPGPVGTVAEAPFSACDLCPARCRYRGPALAMVRDSGLVRAFEERVRSLEDKDAPKEQVAERWQLLIGELRERVSSFPAIPATEPGLSEAAFCLFLHTLAVRTMRFSAAWPRAVARRLGIASPADEQAPQ
jgi:Helicase HerA, central domain